MDIGARRCIPILSSQKASTARNSPAPVLETRFSSATTTKLHRIPAAALDSSVYPPTHPPLLRPQPQLDYEDFVASRTMTSWHSKTHTQDPWATEPLLGIRSSWNATRRVDHRLPFSDIFAKRARRAAAPVENLVNPLFSPDHCFSRLLAQTCFRRLSLDFRSLWHDPHLPHVASSASRIALSNSPIASSASFSPCSPKLNAQKALGTLEGTFELMAYSFGAIVYPSRLPKMPPKYGWRHHDILRRVRAQRVQWFFPRRRQRGRRGGSLRSTTETCRRKLVATRPHGLDDRSQGFPGQAPGTLPTPSMERGVWRWDWDTESARLTTFDSGCTGISAHRLSSQGFPSQVLAMLPTPSMESSDWIWDTESARLPTLSNSQHYTDVEVPIRALNCAPDPPVRGTGARDRDKIKDALTSRAGGGRSAREVSEREGFGDGHAARGRVAAASPAHGHSKAGDARSLRAVVADGDTHNSQGTASLGAAAGVIDDAEDAAPVTRRSSAGQIKILAGRPARARHIAAGFSRPAAFRQREASAPAASAALTPESAPVLRPGIVRVLRNQFPAFWEQAELDEPLEEFDDAESDVCEAEEPRRCGGGSGSPVRGAKTARALTTRSWTYATIALAFDDHMRVQDPGVPVDRRRPRNEILGDEYLTIQEAMASIATITLLPSKSLGHGTRTNFDVLDFKALIRSANNTRHGKHQISPESITPKPKRMRTHCPRPYFQFPRNPRDTKSSGNNISCSRSQIRRGVLELRRSAKHVGNRSLQRETLPMLPPLLPGMAVATKAATRRTKLYKEVELEARDILAVINAGGNTLQATDHRGLRHHLDGTGSASGRDSYCKGGGKNGKHAAVTEHWHNISVSHTSEPRSSSWHMLGNSGLTLKRHLSSRRTNSVESRPSNWDKYPNRLEKSNGPQFDYHKYHISTHWRQLKE
ncbi:hypothetical protein C8R47DRAFT_1082726 [Mycena vitilis]|nr:hypothetical protein C8R47DRAFT_1082726 [Mycena vitilis]